MRWYYLAIVTETRLLHPYHASRQYLPCDDIMVLVEHQQLATLPHMIYGICDAQVKHKVNFFWIATSQPSLNCIP